MSSPQATRRLAMVALAIIWLLVCGGLAWGTRSAIRLDHLEEREFGDRSYDETLALAVSRLEAAVDAFVGREQHRPYEQYRRLYKPAHAVSAADPDRIPVEPVLLPSPLTAAKPEGNWILLYFQASEVAGRTEWRSPQFEGAATEVPPIGAISFEERPQSAGPENWLAGLRERYTPLLLLDHLEQAVKATQSRLPLASRGPRGPAVGDAGSEAGSHRRTETEFARRTKKLLEYYPADICEPETVALENLAVLFPNVGFPAPAQDCVRVTRAPMAPIWVDLTSDGHLQLALIRSVSVETSAFCALQGILLDWDRLRELLMGEIRDLLPREQYPQLKLEPVFPTSSARVEPRSALMSSLPVRLSPGAPARPAQSSLSTGLKVALVTAWIASLVAMIGITYGVAKYLGLIERRMRFVAAVTHELRTPLTTFQLYTDLLSNGAAADPVKRQTYIETLKGESSRLARLVENVLAYARIGNNKARLSLADVDVGDLLDSVAAETTYRVKSADKHLIVENQCPADMTLRVDREFLVQILSNLIDNACKHAGNNEDKRIWLRAKLHDQHGILFEVEDTGPGVPAAERRGIFQPFRRGRGREATPGMGLGLAMSRYWSECLGGRLELGRGRGGQGDWNCFTLTLPSEVHANATVAAR